MIAQLGQWVIECVENTGRFARFAWVSSFAAMHALIKPKAYPLVLTQMYYIGVKSVPVVMATGAFVGMILALQSYDQLYRMGLQERMGVLINLAVFSELGPVLAAVMLAGRVGGALTAELGTMNVTEQISAVQSMGTNPIHYLVAPRVLACLLLTPFLIIYADLMGVAGGYVVSVLQLRVNEGAYWDYSAAAVEKWTIGTGIFKGFVFGGGIAVISCYKGFTCREGAHGVGRACTEAFVGCFITILFLNFVFAIVFDAIYKMLWPVRSLL